MRHSSSLTSRPPTFNVVRVEINKVAVALHSLSCYYNQTEVNGGMKEIKMIMKVSSSFHKKKITFFHLQNDDDHRLRIEKNKVKERHLL
jgi:hypothetical protein